MNTRSYSNMEAYYRSTAAPKKCFHSNTKGYSLLTAPKIHSCFKFEAYPCSLCHTKAY